MNGNQWKIVDIVSRGGKSTGKYTDQLYTRIKEDYSESSINWKTGVKELQSVERSQI